MFLPFINFKTSENFHDSVRSRVFLKFKFLRKIFFHHFFSFRRKSCQLDLRVINQIKKYFLRIFLHFSPKENFPQNFNKIFQLSLQNEIYSIQKLPDKKSEDPTITQT